ncbi:MAG: nucleoside triphosphate pyrophosphohydrolase [Paludibacteraceae bacterium]|nr:nucleoside triphosphate pyrophosphohydrolase [Paludibacteraceae bacterium]
MMTREEQLKALDQLLTVMDELREKCPWDRKQTFDSLRTNTIEEVYELSDSIEKHDMHEIQKELGDVLLHVIFYAKMGSETGDFDIGTVAEKLTEKLIFRHPHIYGTQKVNDENDVLQTWEQIKQKEKDGNKTILSGIPKALPSVIKAYRIQDKARNAGFDWDEREQVWDKVKEEIAEFEAEVGNMDADKAEQEFGDVMFSLINAARLYKINPDTALDRTNKKFIRRFTYLEQKVKSQGRNLQDMTLDEMEQIWQESKHISLKDD